MEYGNKTIQYSIYDRSPGRPVFITDTSSIKRPSFEMLSDTITGAGISGEIDFPTLGQLGALSYEITFKRTSAKAVSLFGLKTQELETRWATDVLTSDNGKIKTVANKEIVKAIPKKFDLGSVENNSTNEATVELEVIYYKYIQDGKTLIEIDKLNNVVIIDGVDYAKDIRAAL